MEPAEPGWFDEDARHFIFDAFYQKAEFCDRSVRLEILEECRRDCEEEQANSTGADETEKTPEATEQEPDASGEAPKFAEGRPKAALNEPISTKAPNTSVEEPTTIKSSSNPAERMPDTSAEAPGTSLEVLNIPKEATDPLIEQLKHSGESLKIAREGLSSAENESVEGASEEASGKKRKGEDEPPRKAKKRKEDAAQEKQPSAFEAAAPEDKWVEEIPVSSVILAAKSSVLRTMLSNGMKETDKGNPIVLKVTPEEKVAIKEMLHFMYAGCLSPRFSSPETDVRFLIDLLAVGDKFEVRSFMGAVLRALSARIEVIKDCEVLALHMPEILEQHHSPIKELTAKARDHLLHVFQKADDWKESEAFLSLGQDTVRFLLQSEDLEADSEEEIFKGVLKWVRETFNEGSDRSEAMCDFAHYIRFGCMRGEFLDLTVLPMKEMLLPKCQRLVKQALRLHAFSEEMKAKWDGPEFEERRGIRDAHLEIAWNFKMPKDGAAQTSPKVEGLGLQWRLVFLRGEESDIPQVSLFLHSQGFEGASAKVDYTFYVRTWPRGLWKRVHVRATEFLNSGISDIWGYSDELGLSWDEVRKSKTYISSTGHINVKVVLYKRSVVQEA